MSGKWIVILALFLLTATGALAADFDSAREAELDISIAKSRTGWNTWEFRAIGLPDTALYLWDFGDGGLGSTREVVHAFPRWGKYKVTLSGSDSAGASGSAETEIAIGFWHIQNIWLQAILGALGLGVLVLAGFIIFDKLPKLKDE